MYIAFRNITILKHMPTDSYLFEAEAYLHDIAIYGLPPGTIIHFNCAVRHTVRRGTFEQIVLEQEVDYQRIYKELPAVEVPKRILVMSFPAGSHYESSAKLVGSHDLECLIPDVGWYKSVKTMLQHDAVPFRPYLEEEPWFLLYKVKGKGDNDIVVYFERYSPGNKAAPSYSSGH